MNIKGINIKVINAGKCMLCGKQIKIDTKQCGGKLPNIFFCLKCERKLKINHKQKDVGV